MEEEKIRIFDESMEYTGVTSREEAHRKGLWHETFHCWVIISDKDGDYLLFQRRSANKKVFPGYLDISAAGHILENELVEDGVREVEEELGIKVNFEDLIDLGIRREVIRENDKEFCHTFLLKSGLLLDEFNIQEYEVDGIFKVGIKDGKKLFSDEVEYVTAEGFQIIDGIKSLVKIKISKDTVIPRLDKYYLKIFVMADLYLKGEKGLKI